MKVLTKQINLSSRKSEYYIDIYGDTHLGTKSVATNLLKQHIDETASSGRAWVHIGDAIDGIVSGDRRFTETYKHNLEDWAWEALRNGNLIDAEWDEFYRLFSPIAQQGLFVLSGDGKHNQMCDVADCFGKTLSKLGLPGGFPACHLLLSFYRTKTEARAIDCVFHHGWFAGRTKSNKLINLERVLNIYSHSLGFFCGHGHDKVAARVESLVLGSDRKEHQVIRRGAMTGSYLRTYAPDTVGYGEIKGYPPVALGRITVVLRPFEKDAEKRIELINC